MVVASSLASGSLVAVVVVFGSGLRLWGFRLQVVMIARVVMVLLIASAAEHVDDLAAPPRELFPILILGLAPALGAFTFYATAFASFSTSVFRGHCLLGGGGVPGLAWALGTLVAVALAIKTLDGRGPPYTYHGCP